MTQPLLRLRWLTFFILCLLLGGAFSIYLGQDASYDLRNYHLHNIWAVLHNKTAADIFVADKQTYYSPLADLPYYLLAIHFFPDAPRLVAFMMGLPFGLLVFIVFSIAWLFTGTLDVSKIFRIVLSVIAALFGVSGVATISQVGTTTNEVSCAAVTLSGLFFLLLFGISSNTNLSAAKRFAFLIAAGTLFGISAGLKLTAAIYAPGAALVSILVAGNLKQRVHHFVCFSGAWSLAFLLLWGPWGLSNYHLTGDPFFPNQSNIFNSSWIGPRSLPNYRHGIMGTLFYPFFWATNGFMDGALNNPFTDPRFAIAWVFVFLALLTYLPFSRARGRPIISGLPPFRLTEAVLVFFVVSYVIWLFGFGVIRSDDLKDRAPRSGIARSNCHIVTHTSGAD